MRRRSPIFFILLNVVVTVVVALIVISVVSNQNPQEAPLKVVTIEVRITNTFDPNATPLVRIITATPMPGFVAALPTGVVDTPAVGTPATPIVTLDAQALGAALSGDTTLQNTATALPPNCLLHVVGDGDTPFGVAETYGADGFTLMAVNGLDDVKASQLQIGDVLIVPLEGCPLTAADVAPQETTPPEETAEATSEVTAETTAEPTVRPTLTLPPTAANAQISIIEITGVGDVTTEGVVIRNNGNTVNVRDWTLSDAEGNTYTFSERALFSNAQVTVFSRTGQDTAIALFWNRSDAAFQPGDTITLRDANGVVQSTYRVPNPVNLG